MKKQKGITLVEVLFSIMMLGLSASILVATTPIASMSRYKADQLNRACNLAQKELEAVRGQGFANINPTALQAAGLIDSTTPIATNTYSFNNMDTSVSDNAANVLPGGRGQLMIESFATDVTRVTVTVFYNERGTQRSYQLVTLVSNI